MIAVSLLSAILSLRFVASFIERRAVHLGEFAFRQYSKAEPRPWIEWGTRIYGHLNSDGSARRTWFVVFRVPGWYWEPCGYDLGREPEPVWCRKYVMWRDSRWPGDPSVWLSAFIPEGE